MFIKKAKNSFLINETFKIEQYQKYLNGDITYDEFCAENNCTKYVMNYYLKTKSLQKRNTFISNAIKNDFFDKIDCEIKAYLLGFYFADGGMCGNRITISLTKDDCEIVNLFKKYISPNSRITWRTESQNKKTGYITKPMVSISISSPKICERLSKIGMGKRKTYIANLDLTIIPDNLFRHFLRGYFDGDGCVCKTVVKREYKTKKGKSHMIESENFNFNIISYKREHLDDIVTIIKRIYGITPNLLNDSRGYFLLEINRKDDFFKMRDILYSDSNFYLKRKKEKYYSIFSTKVKNDRKVRKVSVLDGKEVKVFNKVKEAAIDAGITPEGLGQRIRKHLVINGFKWEYVD